MKLLDVFTDGFIDGCSLVYLPTDLGHQ